MIIKIIKESDDPMKVLRASIGGTKVVGFYLVYRGDLKEIIDMLETVTKEARNQQQNNK